MAYFCWHNKAGPFEIQTFMMHLSYELLENNLKIILENKLYFNIIPQNNFLQLHLRLPNVVMFDCFTSAAAKVSPYLG